MKADTLNGQLDPLILATVAEEPAHGYAILQRLKERSSGAFDLAEGTIYPALHRLERQKWIRAEWTVSERNQRTRIYELTAAGRRQLLVERSRWEQLTAAIGAVLSHPTGDTE